jgi:small conductance mechanosensitive channel
MVLLMRFPGRWANSLRPILWSLLLSLSGTMTGAVASFAEELTPASQDTVMRATMELVTNPTIDIVELEQLVRPLRESELDSVAGTWIDLVQARAMLLNLESEEDAWDDETLKALVVRAQVIVRELEKKGGDAAKIEKYQTYLAASSGMSTQEAMWAAVRDIWPTVVELKQIFRSVLLAFLGFLPSLAVISLLGILLSRLNRWLRRGKLESQLRFWRPLIVVIVTGAGLILVVLVAPMSNETQGQLISLVGLGMTAVIAISSTTLVANAMAGVILRSVGNFKPSDWLEVGEQFGRVTKLGLFSTEIQTEENDLTTLPNSYLITNPVKVVHESGTYVTVDVSLGYDNSVAEIVELLETAAKETVLKRGGKDFCFNPEDCYVQVHHLGDFSITYRAIGFLQDVEYLHLMRSVFRRKVVFTLHENGIEIVSPTFMNQRVLTAQEKVIPEHKKLKTDAKAPDHEGQPTEKQFEKADQAGEEQRKARLAQLDTEIEELNTQLESAAGDAPAHLETQESLQKLATERDEILDHDDSTAT